MSELLSPEPNRLRSSATSGILGAASPGGATETVIAAKRGWQAVDFRELWRYRELFFFLIWRDIKVRYKQTVLGIAWAIVQPVMQMVIFSVIFGMFIFGRMRNNPLGATPYPLWVFAGLLPWGLFSQAVSQAGLSTITEAPLLKKVYFPRLIAPISRTGTAAVDFLLGFLVYAAMMVFYRHAPGLELLLLPALLLLTIMAALGVSFILAAVAVAYRDVRALVPFILQLWMFATPVVYPASVVPERYHWILSINPMAGIVAAYRWALVGEPMDWMSLGIGSLVAASIFVFGLYYFRRAERRFADVA